MALALLGILVGSALLGAPPARAWRFPVQSEQVVTGTTTGLAGAQADDGIQEVLTEVDTAPDPVTTPSTRTITDGTEVSGTFPGDIASADGLLLRYRQTLPVNSNHYPGTQTVTTGSNCGGSFPASLQSSDNAYLCLREANAPAASIGFDAVTSTTLDWGSSVSWSHTASGVNRLLVVGVAIRNNNTQTVSSIRYGGTNLVFVRANTNSNDARAELWYLVNPVSGTNTVQVNLSAAARVAAGAITLTGVNQTSPLDAHNGATGGNSSPSATVTTGTDNAWLIDVVAFRSSGTGQPTGTPGAGQTQRWSQYTEFAGSDVRGKGSTRGPVITPGPTTMSWSLASSVGWAISAAAFRPADLSQRLNVRHDWSGIPTNGDAYDLCVEAHISNANGESMLVQVLTPPSTWTTRITVTKTSDDNSDQCYTMAAAEFNSGSPSIRWVGGTEIGDTTQSDLNIDHERVIRRFLNYRMDFRYDWAGVPSGNSYTLTMRGYRGDEDVGVQVLTPPSTWTTRITVSAISNTQYTYSMTAAEFNGGNPAVRFLDSPVPDSTASDLYLDWVVVTTVNLRYSLDVRQNVTGIIDGLNPTLIVKGDNSAGGENFDVQAWNFTAGAWNLLLASPFTAANAYHNASLASDQISVGTVRIRFLDAATADTARWGLSLDYVAVDITNGPASLANGGVVPASGNITTAFTFFVRYRDAENESPAFLNLTLGGTPSPMVENNSADTNYADGKDYHLVLTIGVRGTFGFFFSTRASKGDTTLAQTGTQSVSVVNRRPSISNPVAIDGVHTGRPYMRDFNGTDLDGDSLVWSLATNASWLSIGSANGTVWGVAPAVRSAYWVNVTASDGYGGLAWDAYTLSVGNLPPSISNPLAGDAVHATRAYARDFNGTDPDGDVLAWSMSSNAPWLSIGPANGTVWGRAPGTVANYFVNVSASDGFGGSSWNNYTLTVGNQAPAIANPILSATSGRRAPFLRDFNGTDPDGDAMAWSLRSSAAFLAIGPGNGTVYGTTANVPATYWVEVTVSDGLGGTARVNFTLNVVNAPPQLTVTTPGTAMANDSYQGSVSGFDPDGDSLVWSFATNASWLSMDPSSGTLGGTAVAGVYYANVTVRDPYGGTAYRNLTILVQPAPSPPPPPPSPPGGAGDLLISLLLFFLGAGALAFAIFLVAKPRRRPIVEQAFLLGADGAVRFEFSAAGAPFDEARLRSLLSQESWRELERLEVAPHFLHFVRRTEGHWVLVSRNADAVKVRKAAERVMARAKTDLPPLAAMREAANTEA